MSTIKDYLKYYKNSTFDEYKFNELDNILFSELSYINWKGIVSAGIKKIKLNDAIKIYLDNLSNAEKEKMSPFMKSNIDNLEIIKDSIRYKHCYLSNFINDVNDKKQFGALCIMFNEGDCYVGFKGTDSTLVGWKEDMALGYTFPTLAQVDAINYLNQVINWKVKNVYVGGHSKGGNLAMCAYMYANKKVKKKVKQVFNNDGPGFRDKEYNSNEYQELLLKLKMFVPEGSIVGILLNSPPYFKVVKSTNNGPYEHDCNTWMCFGSFFVEGVQSNISKKFKEKIDEFINNYTDSKKEKLVNSFFKVLEEADIKSFNEISSMQWNQFVEIVKGINDIDAKTKDLFLDVFKNFIMKRKDKDKKK